ncbi:uncharacterized protein LOC121368944 [Gigantopelta aegis]|uniref:uncharacterized protein LOC121368944 n=1 Tax=Gigantopelta aegis TaxID=1735272 RepID=UPI001B888CF0|nr:uncharacterized protein LOC121368944 [Gigantopelta aegis]
MVNPDNSFPMLYVRGSNYDVGFSIGGTFSNRIKMYINECKGMNETIIPFYDSPRGRAVFDLTLRKTEDNFPQYVDEIKGTALGVGLPFERLFLLNMERDIVNGHARVIQEDNTGCSTVLVNTPDVKLMGHNEDGNPTVRDHGYMLSVAIENEAGRVDEQFVGMCYPGKLPGNTLSFNYHGLVTAMDNIRVKQAPATTPSQIVLRAMMAAKHLGDLVTILTNKGFGCVAGMAVNVWSLNDLDSPSVIELCPSDTESSCHVIKIEEPSYYHVNMFRHREADELLPKTSSVRRTERIKELSPPRCFADIRDILGDTEVKDYPLYRLPSPTDNSATYCTSIVDMLNKELVVYRGNPKTSRPLIRMPLTLF